MIRAGLDSNILVYAELEPETDKGKRSQHIIASFAPRGILAVQSLLEFIAVVRRKRPESLASALQKVRAWSTVFETAPTTQPIAATALDLVRDHRFQTWDAVIWAAVSDAGASVFFTEDLQDGFSRGTMRARNPFAMSDADLDELLKP
jgi:predicted nucleic acid-binding protein